MSDPTAADTLMASIDAGLARVGRQSTLGSWTLGVGALSLVLAGGLISMTMIKGARAQAASAVQAAD